MDPIVSEWLGLVVRWVHVISGIAWVGASFYFNWLLNHLRAPATTDHHALGELWAIHAGGFFHVQKRTIAPGALPAPLHWFKWEAYWTWISGFVLLVLVYYLGAEVYLIDRQVADIGVGIAVTIGIGTLALGWLVYDLLWRSPLAERPRLAGAVSFALVVALAWGLDQVFSGRGAYMHVGALLGTLMAGNVFRIIMPAQRELVAATREGREQDRRLAAFAEQRSLHNNYMTLPVLFVMISNHYPSTYSHELNWVVLAVLFAAGTAVRHYFNVRHRRGNWRSAWLLGAPAVAVAALAYVTAPAPRGAGSEPVAFEAVQSIIEARCVSCHSAHPTSELVLSPPKGVTFDTPEQIRAQAVQIQAQAIASTAMPPGNLTGMADAERQLLARWIAQGAPLE
ncbi:MAG: urate hydroxylase PuuD [Gammaproteobacteria bacterium]|nr:urate hydroxylase PuuD [Gammaproteobacteria bacterium]NIR88832.1 urate hydroxylase PuuD [Gammaproteobacteria bacterium]NIU06436.1 urate hydroxylase PuuD [Gammaproteobacteria bacterium]NIV53328.1 hypothetical protein [Gammaproteobacteria bacterium]NIV74047.1 hypothetical protein [Gammaproteobacteria bacterium]